MGQRSAYFYSDQYSSWNKWKCVSLNPQQCATLWADPMAAGALMEMEKLLQLQGLRVHSRAQPLHSAVAIAAKSSFFFLLHS